MKLQNTPIHTVKYLNCEYYIKRDDMLHYRFSGNKARKLWYFFENLPENITTIVSYGSPQANSLYSLAYFCKIKKIKLDYYIHHISNTILYNANGNYAGAIECGANLIIDPNFAKHKYIAKSGEMFLCEGVRDTRAQHGIEILAKEIESWVSTKGINKTNTKVMLPSGTGTTALFLQKYLKDIEVLTCSCVGCDDYLRLQFAMLETDSSIYPTILTQTKKYHFGKLYKEFFDIYKQLKDQTGIEFELLYDPIGWLQLLKYKSKNPNTLIIYIHQGGLKANETMLERYARKAQLNSSKNL